MSTEEESLQLKKEAIRREKNIALRCEQMLTSALQSRIGSLGFKEHVSVKNQVKLSKSYAESNFTRAERKKDWGEQTGFQMLSIMMSKHGFIHHYGVDRIRKADSKGKLNRGSFHLKIEKRPFIHQAIKSSGVYEYAAKELGAAKAEYILKNIKYILDKYDK